MLKKNILNSLGESEDFIQDHHNRYRGCGSGILQWKREIGLNSEYILGKWEFTASRWGISTDGKLPRGTIRSKGGFGYTDLTGFLLETGQGDSTGGKSKNAKIWKVRCWK